jgi:hypothetical protein
MRDRDQVAIGYQEIIGMDELDDLLDELSGEDIVGRAAAKKQLAQGLANKMARARNIDPRAVALVDRGPGPRRRKVLPGTTTNVGAGATVTITLESEENFRPERLVVDPTNAGSFEISSCKVGTEEQFVGAGQMPASAFSPDAQDTDVHFKTLNVGSKLILVVTNTTAGGLDFAFGFIGTAVD